MNSYASAFYHFPTLWIVERPRDFNFDPNILSDEMYRHLFHCGLKFKVLREGLFIFDFENFSESGFEFSEISEKVKNEDFDFDCEVYRNRIKLMNSYLACLYSMISKISNFNIDKMAMSPELVISKNSIDDEGSSFGNSVVSSLALARYRSTYTQGLPTSMDWRNQSRNFVITKDVLEATSKMFETVLEENISLLSPLDQLIKSAKDFEEHNYEHSLIASWSIIEMFIEKNWLEYVEGNRKRNIDGKISVFINKERKEILLDYSISIKLELMSFAGVLEHKLYEDITKVRKSRNKWIHEMKTINRESSSLSHKCAQLLINKDYSLEMQIPLRSSFHR